VPPGQRSNPPACRVPQACETIDVDGDGVVAAEELVRWLRLLNMEVTLEEATKFLKAADVDGNGVVDYLELSRAIAFRGSSLMKHSRS